MKRVIRGQPVSKTKHEQAKQLRKRMIPAETELWQALRKNRLDGLHFRRQQVIAGFIVDFYCHAVRLIVEADGPIHEQRRGHDAARYQRELSSSIVNSTVRSGVPIGPHSHL